MRRIRLFCQEILGSLHRPFKIRKLYGKRISRQKVNAEFRRDNLLFCVEDAIFFEKGIVLRSNLDYLQTLDRAWPEKFVVSPCLMGKDGEAHRLRPVDALFPGPYWGTRKAVDLDPSLRLSNLISFHVEYAKQIQLPEEFCEFSVFNYSELPEGSTHEEVEEYLKKQNWGYDWVQEGRLYLVDLGDLSTDPKWIYLKRIKFFMSWGKRLARVVQEDECIQRPLRGV